MAQPPILRRCTAPLLMAAGLLAAPLAPAGPTVTAVAALPAAEADGLPTCADLLALGDWRESPAVSEAIRRLAALLALLGQPTPAPKPGDIPQTDLERRLAEWCARHPDEGLDALLREWLLAPPGGPEESPEPPRSPTPDAPTWVRWSPAPATAAALVASRGAAPR